MDLKTYFVKLSLQERKAFAVRCRTTVGHLRNVAYGFKPAGESLAINIDRESKGAVRVETMRPDVDWAYIRGTSKEHAA
ncbi:MAG: YdaS family helix-turn-helix protein [Rhodocyclaceae bacterium]